VSKYVAVVSSTWSVERAFDYLSDFSNAQYWDPSVRAARRLDDGGVRLGSRFELTVNFAGRHKTLEYTVTTLEPARRVVFASSSVAMQSLDTLTFEPRAAGCEMTYHAELRLMGAAALANPFLTLFFRRLGDRASLSLQEILSGSESRS
jgi:hypothetical protein